MAGDVSNTWVYDHRDPEETGKIERQMYEEQIRWAAEEGVDFVVAETLGHLGEGLIALEVVKEFGLPAVIAFGSVHDKTKDGYSFAEACRIVADRGADVVGMNCSRGPSTMLPIMAEVRAAFPFHMVRVAYQGDHEPPTDLAGVADRRRDEGSWRLELEPDRDPQSLLEPLITAGPLSLFSANRPTLNEIFLTAVRRRRADRDLERRAS